MSASDPEDFPPPAVVGAVRDSGLIEPGSSGVVLLSGGPDSICLTAGLAGTGLASLVALHLNYGLRDDSDRDQGLCEAACERLGIELVVERTGEPEGNIQGWARGLRYRAAERLREARGADWIAVGHTQSDVAETVLYRLASSPGRRALSAMKPVSGFVVRPLIGLTRSRVRELAVGTGLEFADDPSNRDPAFARVRIRDEVMPVLEQINPSAAANAARTRAELTEEGDLLDELARSVTDRLLAGGDRLDAAKLAEEHPAMRRLVIRTLVERETGRPLPVSIETAREAMRLGSGPEGGQLDLGSGWRLVIEAGTISVAGETAPVPAEVVLRTGNEAIWDGWKVAVERARPPFQPTDPAMATLDSGGLSSELSVRGWVEGDSIQPLGMEGRKKLQDLFTDRGVPRSARHRIPVFLADGEIVWVAGIAISHRYRLRPETTAAVRLHAIRQEP